MQFVITRHPLIPDDGPFLPGSAPLPFDFDVATAANAALDQDALIAQGVKGLELAFRLAGEEFQNEKESTAATKRVRAASMMQSKNLQEAGGEALLRFIEKDDGGEGEEAVSRADFPGLIAKWGSRLRIRATDDEIFYRLTGSHERVRMSLGPAHGADSRLANTRHLSSTSSFSRRGRGRMESQPSISDPQLACHRAVSSTSRKYCKTPDSGTSVS